MLASGAAAGPSAAADGVPRMTARPSSLALFLCLAIRGKGTAEGAFVSANAELLRMGELAEASGVPAPTIKHYLREGLLPEPVKTSRNMAYYPPEFVDRIKLIKRLQEERFMPLKAIKSVLDEDPERAGAMLELEDRILDRALAGERARTSADRGPRALRRPQGGARPARRAGDPQPQQSRLLALRRHDHRGDRPLPRRRLRRADRLHRLRHPALQEGARRRWSTRRSTW